MNEQQHPLIRFPEDQKIDYLCLVASLASADGTVSNDEITIIRQFCESIAISMPGIGVIMSTVEDPSVLDVQATLRRLAHTELKFTLLADLLCMAYADGVVSPAEREEINDIGVALEIIPEHIAAIDKYLQEIFSRPPSQTGRAPATYLKTETTETLRSLGIPLSAIRFSTSLDQIRTKDLTKSLGSEHEIGVALPLGLGNYFGVRWLFHKLRRNDSKDSCRDLDQIKNT